jgi:drug/metabolite transporter (DMT)-like permease
MIIIPHQSQRSTRPATQHDMTVGMLIVAVIMLAIALLVFIVGPLSHNPAPPAIGWVVLGIAALFAIISFFSWMKEQSDALGGGNNSNSES